MKAIRYWDGHAIHPFAVLVTERLSQRGFAFTVDEWCNYSWRAPLFDGYESEIGLIPIDTPTEQRAFGFQPFLFVNSPYQATVDRHVGTHDFNPPCVLSISLSWLMTRWPPVLGTFSENYERWCELKTDDSKRMASKFCDALESHAFGFFEMVSSPERLIGVLSDLENFPGVGKGSAPGSSSPKLFAAALLVRIGGVDHATAMVQSEMTNLKRLFSADGDAVEYERKMSRFGAYLSWIEARQGSGA